MTTSPTTLVRNNLNLPVVSSNFDHRPSMAHKEKHVADFSSKKPSGAAGTSRQGELLGLSQEQRPSYARVTGPNTKRRPDISAHKFQALRPIRHGEHGKLVVPRELQEYQLNKFKYALIGRLILNKGDKPRQSRDLKAELQSLWKISSPWQLMSMGKGFFTIKFQSQEDKAVAKAHMLWELSVGSLRLREWVRYFDPYKESSSLAQVWVRIYYLPVEFWHPEVISGIGHWLGQPLKIDSTSMTDDVAHFVRILVEIDLAQPLPETFTVDGGDRSFVVEFSYEYLPTFCTRCKITGHTVEKCRRGVKNQQSKAGSKKDEPKKQEWIDVGKPDGPVLNCNNSFEVLNEQEGMGSETQPQLDQLEQAEVHSPVGLGNTLNKSANKIVELNETRETHAEKHVELDSQEPTPALLEKNNLSSPDLLDELCNRNLMVSDTGKKVASQQVDGEVVLDHSLDNESRKEDLEEIVEHAKENPVARASKDNTKNLQDLLVQQIISEETLRSQATKRGRGRPRKQEQLARNHNLALMQQEENIKNRLRKSVEAGHSPKEYVIDYGNSACMRSMDNVVNKRWADEVELEERHSTQIFNP
ncbi:uncharacterized protein LOC131025857 [Salvia miltiorrhiza]|uniref:uncharacterized protein LOC131025857 n=1 Tax=Salvia miltiorrhiza TaxID=226208 RepID=UPI0025ACF9E4|nr:uncharacterized protein LOC131025857 [Salvia miltiorrhiza]